MNIDGSTSFGGNVLRAFARQRAVTLACLSAAVLATLYACSAGEVGSVTLRWIPPPANEDGSELDDLAGYRVYWRPAGGSIEQVVVIDDPASTSYEIEGLPDGEWHAGVSAFTHEALESDLATVVFTMSRGEVSIDESTLGRIASRAEFDEPVAANAATRAD